MNASPPVAPPLLRALLFAGLIEAMFYRLGPLPHGIPGWGGNVRDSLHRGGELMFFAAYALGVASLINLSWRAIRDRRWPAGLNGFLSVCFLSLALLGAAAVTGNQGPSLAMGFTLLSLITIVALGMHAFSAAASPASLRAFSVAYAAAALCSAMHVTTGFAARLAPATSLLPRMLENLIPAGEALLGAAAVCVFLAFHDARLPGAWGGAWPAALAAAAVAAGSLVPAGQWGVLGEHPHPVRVILMTGAVFLAGLTGAALLRDPQRRSAGFGLLLLLIAGYPLRIAHQQMLMVVGAALLLAPRAEAQDAPQPAPPAPRDASPPESPQPPASPAPPEEPAFPPGFPTS